jgi:hypothetical protein
MFDKKVINAVIQEAQYAEEKWGTGFDDLNTLNDWVAYICMYATDAAKITNQNDTEAMYGFLIKASGLALNAADRIDRQVMPGRHYDLDQTVSSVATEHGKGRAFIEKHK